MRERWLFFAFAESGADKRNVFGSSPRAHACMCACGFCGSMLCAGRDLFEGDFPHEVRG